MEHDDNWLQTFTGVKFYIHAPRKADIRIEDIAHSLSLKCRFGGHCRVFYSVAQHSVLVSEIIPPEHAFWGLMHDAAEAYCGDMVRPLKNLQPDFRIVEKRLMDSICYRFGMSTIEPLDVKIADNILLATERRDLMGKPPAKWTECGEPMATRITPLGPDFSEGLFLQRFYSLYGGR